MIDGSTSLGLLPMEIDVRRCTKYFLPWLKVVPAAPGQLPQPTDQSHLTPSKSACGGRHQAPGTAGQGLLQPWVINIREEVSNTEPVLHFEM